MTLAQIEIPKLEIADFCRRRTPDLMLNVTEIDLESHLDRVLSLMKKYADTPMDFVDACLVAMTEAKRDCKLLTLDSDFRVYRRLGRLVIPVLMPESL